MDLLKIDFERTRVMHILLKTRLRAFLTATDNWSEDLADFVCPVEEWTKVQLLTDSVNSDILRELRDAYTGAHSLVHEILNNTQPDKQKSFAVMDSVFEKLRMALLAVEKLASQEVLRVVEDDSEQVTLSKAELRQLYGTILKLDDYSIKQESDSKKAYREAEENSIRFKDTVRQAPVAMAILQGRNMVVEMANYAYLAIVDKKEREFVGKTLFASLPEVEEAVGGILLGVFDTGRPFYGNEFEVFLNRHGQKERCYFNFVYQPFKNGEEVVGVIVVANEVTEQVKAKKALERREYQFRNLVTQSQFAKAIFKGEDFVVSLVNESLLKIWRRELHEVEGQKLLELFPELNGQMFPELLKKVYATGEIYKENEAVAFIDGPGGMRKHYLDFQYAPMFEIDGSVSAIMVSVNDVTEKVELRQQFEEAAERLSLATDGTNLATWDLNIQTREVIYSPRLAEIFGVENGVVLSHADMRNMLQSDDRENIVDKAFAIALETGFYNYDARFVRPDKSVHWIRVQGKVLFDENHLPLRMLGTMMDITERIEAEFALRTSEQKFRLLSDSMPQLVWTGDPEGHMNYFNHAVYEYTGLTWEELANDGWFKIVHQEDRVENLLQWREAVKMGQEFVFEHRFRRHDGEYRWQLSRATPQKGNEGEVEMWVGTSTDIHDRKMFISELEQKVQQRTKELTVMNHELIKTNLELGQFAYVASHDLQEPLRKIQMLSTRIFELEAATFSEKGKDYLQRLQASSIRMQQLISDLLAFSRANLIEKHFENTDLNLVLTNVKEQLSELIQQKGAVIVSDSLPSLDIIVYQFEQLFTNLITNSLKFIKPGKSPVVTIASGTILGAEALQGTDLQPDKSYHFISFHDNGIGFESQFSERIFQVFQRLHGKDKYEGTGIGLAICKKIVENHQGVIVADGEAGVGATFTLYVPIEK